MQERGAVDSDRPLKNLKRQASHTENGATVKNSRVYDLEPVSVPTALQEVLESLTKTMKAIFKQDQRQFEIARFERCNLRGSHMEPYLGDAISQGFVNRDGAATIDLAIVTLDQAESCHIKAECERIMAQLNKLLNDTKDNFNDTIETLAKYDDLKARLQQNVRSRPWFDSKYPYKNAKPKSPQTKFAFFDFGYTRGCSLKVTGGNFELVEVISDEEEIEELDNQIQNDQEYDIAALLASEEDDWIMGGDDDKDVDGDYVEGDD